MWSKHQIDSGPAGLTHITDTVMTSRVDRLLTDSHDKQI